MKIALLSNVTVDVLAGMLKKQHEVWLAPGFDAWQAVALKVPKELVEFAPDAIWVLLDAHFAPVKASASERSAALSDLCAAFPKVPVIVPDLTALARDFGEDFYDEKMWKLGSMPWSLTGLREMTKLFGRKKVLAVDLDNTLWQGVIGEDGVAKIEPKTEFQRQLLELKARGILLVAISKNNAEDVEQVWSKPQMRLKRTDFVTMRVNWQDKAENLSEVAQALNLGADAFVFVDDNPAERMQMRAGLPEVAVADFPPQLEVFFPEYPVTREDLTKTEQYHAEAARNDFGAGKTFDEYLAGLQICTEIHPITVAEYERVAQLSQKANQFNVCTHRYSVAEIEKLAHAPEMILLTMHARDRFGEQGLVAFVLARITEASAEIVDWVMSCRAMNRRVEFALQRELERCLAVRGVTRILAQWVRTAKNAPVTDLFEQFGFELTASTATVKTYRKTCEPLTMA